jgi:hypothetical protein
LNLKPQSFSDVVDSDDSVPPLWLKLWLLRPAESMTLAFFCWGCEATSASVSAGGGGAGTATGAGAGTGIGAAGFPLCMSESSEAGAAGWAAATPVKSRVPMNAVDRIERNIDTPKVGDMRRRASERLWKPEPSFRVWVMRELSLAFMFTLLG